MEGGGHNLRTGNSRVTGVNWTRRQTLVDVSNIVREDQSSVACERSYLEVVKENTQLLSTIEEKSKLIQVYMEELEKLKVALQEAHQQNWQLAESHSQMLAELNLGKDRLKNLQHELKCTTLVLEQKKLEVQEKQRLNKQLQQQLRAQGKPADVAADACIGGKRKKTDTQITGQIVHQEVPRQKLDERKLGRRQSIAKVQTISSSNVQTVKTASCSGPSVLPLHEEARKSKMRTSIGPSCGAHMEEAAQFVTEKSKSDVTTVPICALKLEQETEPEPEITNTDVAIVSSSNSLSLSAQQQVAGDAMAAPDPSVLVAETQLTAQNAHQEASKQTLGDRKSARRRSISSSSIQSVKAMSCSGAIVPLHEEGSKSTRRKSVRPSSRTQMEKAASVSCTIEESNTADTEHGTKYLNIKEETTNADSSTDVMRGPRPLLAGARRSSLLRPLPLRQAVEKVVSYKEQTLKVKLRRVD